MVSEDELMRWGMFPKIRVAKKASLLFAMQLWCWETDACMRQIRLVTLIQNYERMRF